MPINILNKINFEKKGQVQIMQTVFIVILVFIILFIAFIFYLNYEKESMNIDIASQKEKEGVLVASYMLTTPEISCSQNLDVKQNCFDASKLAVFQPNLYPEYYSDYFKKSNISIIIFFGNITPGVCDEENNIVFPNCNEFRIYENVPMQYEGNDFYYVPVSVFNPLTNSYAAGYARVEVFV